MTAMQVKLNFYIVLWCIIAFSNCKAFNRSEVKLVHVLLRHGERTPEGFYPTDPHKENTFYPNGLGSLTNAGKLTVYNLGIFLRNEYDHLFGDYYTPDKVYVRSTESTRAQMSASLALAGMWPPKAEQRWHPFLQWQPIPVQYKLFKDEDLLDSRACKYTYYFKHIYLNNLTMTEQFIEPYKETFTYIENHSGMKIGDLINLQKFYFIISIEKELGLELPKWTEKIYPEPIYSAVANIYKYYNSDLRIKQINVGYLLQKMINDFTSKIKNIDDRKVLYLYSAHDTTLGYFLDTLTTVAPHVPKYGSAILVELHQNDERYYVKLRYLKSPKDPLPEDLQIPGCEVLCPFERFVQLHSYLMPHLSHKEACDETRPI